MNVETVRVICVLLGFSAERHTLLVALDGMLDELALVIKEHYNLDDISDPSLSTEVLCFTV